MYTDASGNNRFYDNETDIPTRSLSYWNEKVSTNWRTNLAFHYTKGKAIMRTIKKMANSRLWINPIVSNGATINRTDLVRQNG
jgi:iron complex outermembrane receptor protein